MKTLKSEQGCGCKSNIASILANQGVTIMLAGGIGAGAINVLNHWGIGVVRGCSGYAEQLVKDYIQGRLTDSGSTCSHHHIEGQHACQN
jgi:predicted Fe-Mo cluster-binding NifX family protein